MKVLPYGLTIIMMLVIIVPAVSFADSENEGVEGVGDIQEKQSISAVPQTEHEGSESEQSASPVRV